MRDYIFILGRNPELSLAEIISYFKSSDIVYELKSKGVDVVVFLLDENKVDFNKMINSLGGTLKIGEVISENDFDDLIPYEGADSKLKYCISSYGDDYLLLDFKKYLKKWFKSQKIKAVHKKSNVEKLTPRDVGRKTIEYLVYGRYAAKVIAVSNPSEYKKRDQNRPVNDFLKNTSIRLAKIMVNLSQAKKNELFLDPFCGTGVILQEAMLNDINVIGIDLDGKSAVAAQKNCDWINKKYGLKKGFRIITGDSTQMKRYFTSSSVDAVATEPYMGPYLNDLPPISEATKISKELEILYFGVLKNLKKVIRKDAKIAIIVPTFKVKKGETVEFDFLAMLKNLGFEIAELDENVQFPIEYVDKKSKIIRNIYVLN